MAKSHANPPLLTEAQFDLIASLIRSKDPPRTAAFMILVQGTSNREAITRTGLSPSSVSNTLGRFRLAHKKIIDAYGMY